MSWRVDGRLDPRLPRTRRGANALAIRRGVAVTMGGAAGALARWAVGNALAGASTSFPWGTLLVNATGAFGLGLVAVLLTERLPPNRYLRPLIGIGFFGAYTTFSTMALEGVKLIDAGRPETAFLYWVATLFAGQLAGVYGMWTARLGPWIGRRRA